MPSASPTPPDADRSGNDGGRVTDQRSTSQVLTSLLANGQELVAKEIELAKLELKELATDKAIALGLLIVASIFGLFVLAFVGVTIASALMLVWPAWLAWLTVTIGYTLIISVALFVAIKKLRRPAFARTKASIEETKAWVKAEADA